MKLAWGYWMDFNTAYEKLYRNKTNKINTKEDDVARANHENNIKRIKKNNIISTENERISYELTKEKNKDKIERQKQTRFRQILQAVNQ
jgi:hypothetical protein